MNPMTEHEEVVHYLEMRREPLSEYTVKLKRTGEPWTSSTIMQGQTNDLLMNEANSKDRDLDRLLTNLSPKESSPAVKVTQRKRLPQNPSRRTDLVETRCLEQHPPEGSSCFTPTNMINAIQINLASRQALSPPLSLVSPITSTNYQKQTVRTPTLKVSKRLL